SSSRRTITRSSSAYARPRARAFSENARCQAGGRWARKSPAMVSRTPRPARCASRRSGVRSCRGRQALQQRLQGVEALLGALHRNLELEYRGPFELVAVGLALDQLDQHHRVDAGIAGELDAAALRSGVDLGDAELFRLQLEQRQPD